MTRWVGGDLWTRPPVRKGAAVVALTVALLGAYYVSQATTTKAPALVTLAIAGITFGVVVAMSRRDAVSLLTIVLVPLFLVPENYSIAGPLKSVGYPPLLAGLACLGVWAVARWTGAIRPEPWHPFRWTMLVFVLTSMISFAAALTRNLVQAEADSATRMIFPVLAMIGIAMLATDGLTTVAQVETLLKRLVVLTTLEGIAGALEFAIHLDYHALARLPGLVVNTEVGSAVRSGIDRIEAAAAHPIEFSLALATAVPLALHFALNADTPRSRRLFWVCFAILAGVIPLTVSRTGLLGIAICIAVYGAVLEGRARANLFVLSSIGLVAFPVMAPGVLGTIKSFVFAGTADDSITGTPRRLRPDPAADGRPLVVRAGLRHLPAGRLLLPRQPVPHAAADRGDRQPVGLRRDLRHRRQRGSGCPQARSPGPRTATWPRRSPHRSSPSRSAPGRSTSSASSSAPSSCSCSAGARRRCGRSAAERNGHVTPQRPARPRKRSWNRRPNSRWPWRRSPYERPAALSEDLPEVAGKSL